MKHKLIFFVLALSLVACRKGIQHEEDEPQLAGLTAEATVMAITETELSTLSEALDDNIDYLSGYAELMESLVTKAAPVCPGISIQYDGQNRFPQTIRVEYGNGCKGKRSHNISGTILIYKPSAWLQAESSRIISFENFSIDGVTVSGSKTMRFDGTNNGMFNFSVISDLTFTWSDGYWVRRVQDKTRSFIAGIDTPEDADDNTLEITGTITDTDSNGTILAKKITHPLVAIAGCNYFVSGTIEVSQNNELLFLFDYGQGNCDHKATITLNDDSREILLNKTRKKL